MVNPGYNHLKVGLVALRLMGHKGKVRYDCVPDTRCREGEEGKLTSYAT